MRVGRSGERRFGLQVIGSKAQVTWYYETGANHSQATPSASDSRRFLRLASPSKFVKIKFCTESVKRFTMVTTVVGNFSPYSRTKRIPPAPRPIHSASGSGCSAATSSAGRSRSLPVAGHKRKIFTSHPPHRALKHVCRLRIPLIQGSWPLAPGCPRAGEIELVLSLSRESVFVPWTQSGEHVVIATRWSWELAQLTS